MATTKNPGTTWRGVAITEYEAFRLRMIASANYEIEGLSEEEVGIVRQIVERWDANDATEFVL